MKKIFGAVFVLALFLGVTTPALAVSRVGGYHRSNGTYVNSYYRSDRNYTRVDNYSYHGNYNPYTGKKGYKW